MEDLLLSYLTKYYEEHQTINDFSRDTVVEYEGKTLKVGELLSSIRKQYRLYLKGDKSRGSMSPKSLNRYQVLNSLGFIWEPRQKKTKELVLLKTGDYMLDMSKLVFGGVILVGIMQIEGVSNKLLLITGCTTFFLFALFGLMLMYYSQYNKKKGA